VSADNYYVIRRHPGPEGGYAAVMAFASDSEDPHVFGWHAVWPTVGTALKWATAQYSEYGVTVHPECHWNPKETTP
jgi:hypothetical protein